MPTRVAIVTDSTASLSPATAAEYDITVVGLVVTVGADSFVEGDPEVAGPHLAAAMRAKKAVTTSRPSPAAMLDHYEALAHRGVEAILAVHLSSDLSGTYESALIAARQCSIPVTVLDTRQIGPALGFAAVAAARVLGDGGSLGDAVAAAEAAADSTRSYFYVDSLEYLRRGGRIGAAQAMLGGALSVKPLLTVADGNVGTVEKVRTASKALARLEQLILDAADDQIVRVVVAHLDAEERARDMAARISQRLGEHLLDGEVELHELGAVIGAHVGPGTVAACVLPAD